MVFYWVAHLLVLVVLYRWVSVLVLFICLYQCLSIHFWFYHVCVLFRCCRVWFVLYYFEGVVVVVVFIVFACVVLCVSFIVYLCCACYCRVFD
jgi:hypothetical protein